MSPYFMIINPAAHLIQVVITNIVIIITIIIIIVRHRRRRHHHKMLAADGLMTFIRKCLEIPLSINLIEIFSEF